MISLKEYLVTEMGKYRLGRIPKSVAAKIHLIGDYIQDSKNPQTTVEEVEKLLDDKYNYLDDADPDEHDTEAKIENIKSWLEISFVDDNEFDKELDNIIKILGIK